MNTDSMKLTSPWTGILSFFIVLFMMPLGHAAMILMEKLIGGSHLYLSALLLGVAGVVVLLGGVFSRKETRATLAGLFGGLFVWTGWVEFAYVYYAHRFGVQPLVENGEVVTKPEYLIMPSSIGLWAILMLFYIFNARTGCTMFNWIQRRLHCAPQPEAAPRPASRNPAMTAFMEMNVIMWTCYLVLLLAYDDRFLGDRHPVTIAIALGSLLWSVYLFLRLVKIRKIAYAIRYAIPTVIIFWTFVEIAGRWNLFEEIWVHPLDYWREVTGMALALFALVGIVIWKGKHK